MYNLFRAAFSKISSDLSQKVNHVTSELKIISKSMATHRNDSAPSPGSSNPSGSSIFNLLANSKLLPRLEPGQFRNLKHWFPQAYWKLRRQAQTSKNTAVDKPEEFETDSPGPGEPKKKILSCFLEDQNRDPISETEEEVILSMASGFWQYLLNNKRAPKSFHKANLELKLQWQTLMESNFECLRYCDNHWKVDQTWINYYPSWLKSSVRAKARANDSVIDVDPEDSGEDGGDNKDNDPVVKVVGRRNQNKRGASDSGRADSSKCPRVEGPENSTPCPRPVPTQITTNRARVLKLFPPAVHILTTF